MKRILVIPAILALVTAAAAESRFFLAVGANYIRPADAGFRTVYGGQAVYPEISAAIRVVKGFCLTGSAGKFSRDGASPDLGFETRAEQSYFTAGIGYLQRVSRLICVEAGAGIAGLSFREDAFDVWVHGRRRGFMAEGGLLLVPEDERIFLALKVGYLSARADDIDSAITGDQPVRLGGLKVAVSIGIQLFGTN